MTVRCKVGAVNPRSRGRQSDGRGGREEGDEHVTGRRAERRGRAPLSRERVLRTAIRLADQGGIEALSMRKLGQELGVEAMSLYNHVASKDDLLDGITDLVLSEIEL